MFKLGPKSKYLYVKLPDLTHFINYTHTHTHTHVGFYGLQGLSIGLKVFILYKLYAIALHLP